MRISRPCYDKMHRCPGWIGGGDLYAKTKRCDYGRIKVDYEAKFWKWRTHRCDKCDVLVLPYMVRYLDWRGLRTVIYRRWRDLKWRLRREE